MELVPALRKTPIETVPLCVPLFLAKVTTVFARTVGLFTFQFTLVVHDDWPTGMIQTLAPIALVATTTVTQLLPFHTNPLDNICTATICHHLATGAKCTSRIISRIRRPITARRHGIWHAGITRCIPNLICLACNTLISRAIPIWSPHLRKQVISACAVNDIKRIAPRI